MNQDVTFKKLPLKVSGEPRQSLTGLEVMVAGGGGGTGLGVGGGGREPNGGGW